MTQIATAWAKLWKDIWPWTGGRRVAARYEKFAVLETEYGVEISVEDYETADEFDDFLVEERDIDVLYLRPLSDGHIFGLGLSFTREQATKLLQAFRDGRAP